MFARFEEFVEKALFRVKCRARVYLRAKSRRCAAVALKQRACGRSDRAAPLAARSA